MPQSINRVHRSRTLRCVLLPMSGLLFVVIAACSGTDSDAWTTLPPIQTTTTIATTSTTISEDRIFYVIKPGESLSVIAQSFGVTVQSIVELNELADPNSIAAGQTIEIPRGIVIVDELPTISDGE